MCNSIHATVENANGFIPDVAQSVVASQGYADTQKAFLYQSAVYLGLDIKDDVVLSQIDPKVEFSAIAVVRPHRTKMM